MAGYVGVEGVCVYVCSTYVRYLLTYTTLVFISLSPTSPHDASAESRAYIRVGDQDMVSD